MMTKEQLTKRYDELYQIMATSKDPKKMIIFGEAEKWVFNEMVKIHPEMAEKWLDHLEPVEWNNSLSEKEAMNIGLRIVNQDGSKGFHWPHEMFLMTVMKMGGKAEEKPYYNSYALCVTANMIYSDHAQSISMDLGYNSPQDVPNDKMLISCYRKAVESLKDVDGGFHVRKYFKSKMYDNSPLESH